MWNSIRVHMNVCGMTGLSMNSCIFYYYEDPGKFYVIHHFIAASSTEYGHMATVCVCGCASAQDALCCVPTSDADDITDSLLNYLMKRFSCSPYALCTALMHANELIFIYSCTLNGQQHHHLHTCDDVVWHCDTATLKWIPHKVWMERIDGRMVNMANGDICTPHTTHTHTSSSTNGSSSSSSPSPFLFLYIFYFAFNFPSLSHENWHSRRPKVSVALNNFHAINDDFTFMEQQTPIWLLLSAVLFSSIRYRYQFMMNLCAMTRDKIDHNKSIKAQDVPFFPHSILW